MALDFAGHPGLVFAAGSDSSQLLGLAVDNASGNGVTLEASDVTLSRNLMAGNRGSGIELDGASGSTVADNRIGTNPPGTAAVPNGGNGILVTGGSHGNEIGGTAYTDPATGQVNDPTGDKGKTTPVFVVPPLGNLISGNRGNGLRVTSSDSVTVHANFFGVGADNATLLGNGRDGIRVDGSSAGTTVGGVIPLGNVTAGNGANGIEVTGTARGFTTFNSFAGSLAFKGSAAAAPNGADGLLIDGTAHGNTIGGNLPSIVPQNTFSGNRGYGLAITGRAHGNRVFGTLIGTRVLGTAALANGRGGVLLSGRAHGNVVGPTTPAPSDLISGNDGAGVTLTSGTSGNAVLNNYIGLGKSGQYLPNRGVPLVNDGRGNRISGNQTGPLVPVTG